MDEIAERRKKQMTAYRSAKTYQELLDLTRKFGDKPGFAYRYWNARMRARGGR
jgi:hypothetical protein